MEMSQRNSLCRYFKQKCHLFFSHKIREEEDRTGPVWGVGTSGKGKDLGKEWKRLNMVQTLYTHVRKWKNETC
jgi:hypothetical protein